VSLRPSETDRSNGDPHIALNRQMQANIPPAVPLLPIPPLADIRAGTFPPPPAASVQLTSLMGIAPSAHLQTLHALYATQIATLIWALEGEAAGDAETMATRRPVVVGVALKRDASPGPAQATGSGLSGSERAVFLGVVAMLVELLRKSGDKGESA
jgi:proteasome assembly chaperone 3